SPAARAQSTMGPQAAPNPGAPARAQSTMGPQAAPNPGALARAQSTMGPQAAPNPGALARARPMREAPRPPVQPVAEEVPSSIQPSSVESWSAHIEMREAAAPGDDAYSLDFEPHLYSLESETQARKLAIPRPSLAGPLDLSAAPRPALAPSPPVLMPGGPPPLERPRRTSPDPARPTPPAPAKAPPPHAPPP